MATASSWRSGNAPRWSQGGAGNGPANHQSTPAANSIPRSMSNSNNNANTGTRHGSNGNEASEAESVQRDRMLYLLVGLIGNTVVATTRSGVKYVGILSSTSTPTGAESEPLGAVLSCAQQIFSDGALGPLKKMLVVKGEDLDGLSAKSVGLDVPVSMSTSNRAGFRTDTEISKKALEPFGEGRALQKWADDVDDLPLEAGGGLSNTGSSATGGWDQFAANEARFGVKSNYEETLYTTKLDKSSKDYKERERKADQLAKEIMGSSTNNIHIAEERGIASQGEGQTEEDRYGAVVRGPNAYVPPAARRAGGAASNGTERPEKSDGPQADQVDGTALAPIQIPTITNTPAAKEDTAGASVSTASKAAQPGPDAVGDFRQFVSSERERLEKKKAALAKKEKDSKLADLKNWGDKFKLKFPVAAGEGTSKDGTQKSISPSAESATQKPVAGPNSGTTSVGPSPTAGNVKPAPVVSTTPKPAAMPIAEAKATMGRMTIPKIPPFNPDKARARQSENNAAHASPVVGGAAAQASPAAEPASASKSAFKLSAKASSFKPFNPAAAAFTPGGLAGAGAAAPAPAAAAAVLASAASPSVASTASTPAVVKLPAAAPPAVVVPANPFFGNRVLKKHASLHVREDFNPFKNAKVPESQAVGPTWGFTGKGYRNLFHVVSADEPGSSTGPMNAATSPPGVAMPPHMMQMGMHPQHIAAMANSMSAGRPHLSQQQPPPHQNQQQLNPAAAMTLHNGQPFYMPYGAAAQGGQYRFQGQPMQHVPAGYGQMPPQYMAFSPQMQPSGGPPPGQMYSPQMGQMFPHGASMHAMGGGAPAQMSGAGPPRNGGPGKGPPPPPQMYYPHVPFVPGAGAAAGGPMSPGMRHQQSQSMQQPPQQQPPKDPSQHSGTPSQAGSTTG